MDNQNEKINEKLNNSKGQKPIVFNFSTLSLGLGFWGLLVAGLVTPGFACGLFGVIGLVFGLAGLYQRKKRDRRLISNILSISGLAINMLVITMAVFSIYSERVTHVVARQMICGTNLASLGKAMILYADDHNDIYPTADKWCDLLIENTDVTERMFVCPSASKGRCHYAINPNCQLNSPLDIVLLFETKAGWNQFGGQELLTTENHQGKGCNVLFNDMHVEFFKTQGLDQLKWKPEKAE